MPPSLRRLTCLVTPTLALLAIQPCQAEGAPQVEPDAVLPLVTVTGNYSNAVGISEAASAGVVNHKLMESRPTLRPAEVLEFVPGLIVSQHSNLGQIVVELHRVGVQHHPKVQRRP